MYLPELSDLLAPGVTAMGFELVAVELVGSGSDRILRVYIDRPGGIVVDDCADVSRQVSAVLDVEDPIPGSYTLEVSSPGLDRPLVKPADFERFAGRLVKVHTREPVLGRRNFTGMLTEATGDYVVVEVDGEPYELDLGNIDRARLVPELNAAR